MSVKTANYQVDLYDRERETDSKKTSHLSLILFLLDHDISDTVLHLLDLASRIQEVEFNED